MISPELGTAPRPDTTGIAKYDNVGVLLGISRALSADGVAHPWSGLKLDFDFPETKFPVDNYEVQASILSDFEPGILPANKEFTGLVGEPAASDFSQTGISIVVPSFADIPLRPGLQVFMRVRAVITAGGNSEWSEPVGMACATPPVPTNLGIVAGFTFVPTLLSVVFTDTSTADGTIDGWIWDFGDGSPLVVTDDPTHVYAEAGTYKVTLIVTDDTDPANVGIYAANVSVVAA